MTVKHVFGGFVAVAVLVSGGTDAGAQDVAFSPEATEACLASNAPGTTFEDCVGKSAEACMEANTAGYSTAGMGNCLYAESQWWEARVEAVYAELMNVSREMDQMNGPYAPSQEEALTAYRAAWEAYREAKCGYVMSQWGGGTGGGPAFASCALSENAAFYHDLQTSLPR